MNRCPSSQFAGQVGQVIRGQNELTLRGMGDTNTPFHLNKREAAEELASFAETRSQDDPTLLSLWLLSSRRGDSDYFNLGAEQVSFLANHGYGNEAPPKREEAFASLVRAGIEDLADEQAEQQHRGSRALQEAVGEARAEIESEKVELKAELEDTKAALNDAVAEVADLQKQLEAVQRLHLPEKSKAKPEKVRAAA